MQSQRTVLLALAAAAALAASACDTVYEFEEVDVGGDEAGDEPTQRSNSQFLRAVFADLVGRTPDVHDFTVNLDGDPAFTFPLDETEFLLSALDAVGDPMPMRNVLVAGLVRHAEASVPDKADVADAEQFIRDQFRRFLGREPGAYELRAFLDEWNRGDDVNPRTVIRALIASREYQSF
jgi:hypothetical protein